MCYFWMFIFQNGTIVALNSQTVCCICGKILYPSSEYWPIDIPLYKQRARKTVPESSHVSIAYREK